MNATLTIAAGSAQNAEVCGSVLVIGDLVRETDEVFVVRLTPHNSNDDLSTVADFTVTIVADSEGEFTEFYKEFLRCSQGQNFEEEGAQREFCPL